MPNEIAWDIIADGTFVRVSQVAPQIFLGNLNIEQTEQWIASLTAARDAMRESQRQQTPRQVSDEFAALASEATRAGQNCFGTRHAIERSRTAATAEMIAAHKRACQRWQELLERVDLFVQSCPY